MWKDPEILALAKELFKYGAIAAIIAYLMLKVIVPLVKTMLQPASGRTSTASRQEHQYR